MNEAKPEWDRILSASQKNNPVEIRRLVEEEGVSPSHSNAVGQSAVHIAALWGHVEAVETLISLGAELNVPNKITGGFPLHSVAQSTKEPVAGRIQCAILLIEAGANPSIADNYGSKPEDYAEDTDVAESESFEATYPKIKHRSLKQVLMDGAPKLPLFDLIKDGDVDGVRSFLRTYRDGEERNKGLDKMLNPRQKNPVGVAIDQISDVFELSIQDGSDKTNTTATLHHLVKILDILLLEGVFDTDRTDLVDAHLLNQCRMLSDAYSYSATNDTVKLVQDSVKILINYRRSDPNTKDLGRDIVNLLHDACRRENLALIKFMVETVGVDVNMKGRQGLTPLHFACRSGRLKAAELLVQLGAEISSVDDRGKTPLDAATVNQKEDVILFLKTALKNSS